MLTFASAMGLAIGIGVAIMVANVRLRVKIVKTAWKNCISIPNPKSEFKGFAKLEVLTSSRASWKSLRAGRLLVMFK